MIRYTLILIILLGSLSLKAQCDLKFTVVSEEANVPISYATIVRKESSEGLYSNVDGSVIVTFEQCLEKDSIIISALGFISTTIGIKSISDSDTLILSPSSYDLTEVTVSAKKDINYASQYIFFPQKKTSVSIASNLYNSYLFAQYVNFEGDHQSGYISSVDVFLTGFFKNSDPFRINLLEYDTRSKGPGRPLIHESLIVKKAKKGWNKVDVKKYRIPISKKGIFVVFERLSTNVNDKEGEKHHSLGWIPRSSNEATTFIKLGDQPWTIPLYFKKKKNEILVRIKANVEKKS